MKQTWSILFSLILGFGLLSPLLTYSNNQSEIDILNQKIAEKKKKIAEIDKTIADYKAKINQTHLESVSLNNQVARLDNHITQVSLDVQATQEKLETTQFKIQTLSLEIDDKNKTIERQKRILAELVRSLHHEDGKKMIEVMAAYNSLSDFYDSTTRFQKLQKDLGKTTKNIRLAKATLQEKKGTTEDEKKNYENINQQLTGKKEDLENQIDFKKNLLEQTQASEQKYKTLVNNLKAQYQKIEGDIEATEREVRKKVAEQQKKKPEKFDTESNDLSWPVSSRRVTAYFHDVTYPYRQVFEHNAIDIGTSHGTSVRAAASGYVARAKRCTTASCYSYIMIVHSSGISTVYGHLSALSVSEDQFVTRGDVIGYSGATPGTVGAGPFTTGPHLHFEVRKNGIPVDPGAYLK